VSLRGALRVWVLAPSVLAFAASAGARPMDPALSRLVAGACAAGSVCTADHAAFVRLMSEWGFALLPGSAHAAKTSGLRGFELSLNAAFTNVDAGAAYWQLGTRGERAAGEPSSARNTDPDDWLQLYSFELRKGFGYGVEAAGSLGVMPHTSLLSWGAELSVAVLEGFRKGTLGYLPDIAFGAALREVSGLGLVDLSTLALEARFSKPFVAGGQHVLTPWLGYQFAWVFAESGPIDLTPTLDPLAECGYVGTNVPSAGTDPEATAAAPSAPYDGRPSCSTGQSIDFANDVAFDPAAIRRQRVLVGMSYRYELAKLSAQLITDLLPPAAVQGNTAVRRALECEGMGSSCREAARQWTLAVQLGAVF